MKNDIRKILVFLTALLVLYGCSNNKEKYVKTLNSKLEDLNSLLNYIEPKLSDS